MYDQVPRPTKIAQFMIRVCEKLMNGGDAALSVAKDQQSPLRARAYSVEGPQRSHSAHGDPGYNDQTGAVVCARVRKGQGLYDSFCTALRDLDTSLVRVDGIYDKIMGKAKRHEAERRARVPGSGRCVGCNDYMPGTRTDRIVNGFCPKHNKGWHRAKRAGETRSDYISRVRRNPGVDDT